MCHHWVNNSSDICLKAWGHYLSSSNTVGDKGRNAHFLVLIINCVLQRHWARAQHWHSSRGMFICCSLGAEWLAGTVTHSCVTGSPTRRHTSRSHAGAPCVGSQLHRCTQLFAPNTSCTHPQNVAPLESVSMPKPYAHSWQVCVSRLTEPNASPVCQRVWQLYNSDW